MELVPPWRPGRSGEPAALADDATAVPLGGTAPDAGLLPHGERVLEARQPHGTALAHLLGDLGTVVVLGVEHGRVEAPTCPEVPPLHLLCRHDLFTPHGDELTAQGPSPTSRQSNLEPSRRSRQWKIPDDTAVTLRRWRSVRPPRRLFWSTAVGAP